MSLRASTSALRPLSARSGVLTGVKRCRQCARSLSTVPSAPTTPLTDIIRSSIRATGPVPISRYIQFCLSHPVHGYYAQGDVFGKKGDFITSPEISQVFGELLGIWYLTRWLARGGKSKVRLVELGPGRGTLMEDVLRTLFTFPAMRGAISSVHLVENSTKMQQVQADKLGPSLEERGISLAWSDKIEDVAPGDQFTMLIAHEFFDAMPINAFERTQDGFREVLVDLNPAFDPAVIAASERPFRLALSREPNTLSSVLPTTSSRFASLPVGARVEISAESWKIMRTAGELIAATQAGGAGLVVDYGADKHFGKSFRAFRNHKIVDVFDQPGSSDLTANVDFEYLKESLVGTGTRPLGSISQASFLLALGLEPRLQKLIGTAPTPERKEDLRKGAQRIVDTLGMGSQYRVLGVVDSIQAEQEVYPFPLVTSSPPAPAETAKDP